MEELGGIRPSSANEPGSSPYAMVRRCFRTFKRLWTEQTILFGSSSWSTLWVWKITEQSGREAGWAMEATAASGKT